MLSVGAPYSDPKELTVDPPGREWWKTHDKGVHLGRTFLHNHAYTMAVARP